MYRIANRTAAFTSIQQSSGHIPSIRFRPEHPFTAGYHDVVLTVASDNTVKGYIDGLTDFTTNTTVMDTSNSATETMNFLLDNVAAGGQGEFSDGNIAQLQLYDGVLTDAEALQISQNPLSRCRPGRPCWASPHWRSRCNAGCGSRSGVASLNYSSASSRLIDSNFFAPSALRL